MNRSVFFIFTILTPFFFYAFFGKKNKSFSGNNAISNKDAVENLTLMCDPVSDSLALVALYDATDGANWTNTWDLSQPFNSWYGIEVNGDGCVTCLDLDGNVGCNTNWGGFANSVQLNGTIPPEIGSLTFLTVLSLGNNQLSGAIPPEIGNLVNLSTLSFLQNNLTGEIPTEIGNLINLEEITFWKNNLSGDLPSEIGNLTNLINLNLQDNQLTGSFPSELGNLTNLEVFLAYDNNFNGSIPAEFGNLISLTNMDIHGNFNLNGNLPPELGNLINLVSLRIGETNINGIIPSELGNLTNLTNLSLAFNNLSGEIPPELGNLTSLERLLLYTNNLSGEIPSELGSLTNLEQLRLNDNNLTGSIPLSLGNLGNLSLLHLSNNNLSSLIPSELGNLSNLTELTLFFNNLSGDIPTGLGDLASLEVLRLHNNQFTGIIPSELGNLSNLTVLQLYSNQLSGEIPSELGNLTGLTEFYLSNNKLEGCIPDELNIFCVLGSNTPNNSGYDLTNNPALPFQGDMEQWCNGTPQIGAPCDDGNAATTNDIITSSCGCEGTVVNACAMTDSLALVALYDATDGDNWTDNTNWKVSGMPISTWYGVTTNTDGCVRIINLNNNQLAGFIPSDLGNLTNLIELHLFSNQLTGTIPSELGNLTNLERLHLFDNQLTGSIPSELGSLTNLIELNLVNNQLTGTIPSELGDLINLLRLQLFNNQLTGKIPLELGNLTNLERLYLHNNQLMGCFPDEITSFCVLGFSTNTATSGYNFTNNQGLPWNGDMEQWCNGTPQIGASCDDNNPNTFTDMINIDCNCVGTVQSCHVFSESDLDNIFNFEIGVDARQFMGYFDVDDDGDRDVLVSNQNNNSTVDIYLYENGDLNLSQQLNVPNYVHSLNFSIGMTTRFTEQEFYQDFNGDGIKDLLFSFSTFQTCAGNRVRIYWGEGAPSFFDENNYTELYTSSNGCYVAFAVDYDVDGDMDIFVDRRLFGNQNFIFENDGTGNFTQSSASNTFRDYLFHFVDFTENGFPDLIGASRSTTEGFYIQEGNGTFNFQTIESQLLDKDIRSVQLLDIDSDGDMECIFQNFTDFPDLTRIEVANWDEGSSSVSYSFFPVDESSRLFEILDINLDGLDDIITRRLLSSGNYDLEAYLNNGLGDFSEKLTLIHDSPFLFIDILDFTGTGDFKVVGRNLAADSMFLFNLVPEPQFTYSFGFTCDINQIGNISTPLTNQQGCDSIVTEYISLISPIDNNGLIAYFPFTENVNDMSGWENDGVLNGAITFGEDRFGNVNNALEFTAFEQTVSFPDYEFPETLNDITISFWLKTNETLPQGMGVLSFAKDDIFHNEILFRVDLEGKVDFYIKDPDLIDNFITSTNVVSDDNWHNITATRNGESGECKIYVDGVLDALGLLPSGVLNITSQGVAFGNDQDCVGGCFSINQQFTGLLDDVFFYNRILTDTEIQNLFNTNYINGSYEIDLDTILCPGESIEIGGTVYDVAGTYPITLTSFIGCDSIINLNLSYIDGASIGFADAGNDIVLCDNLNTVALSSNLPTNTTGGWTSLSGATLTNPNNTSTDVNDLLIGPNEFVWSLSTSQCPDYDSDTVIVFLDLAAPLVEADVYTVYIEALYEDDVTQNDVLTDITNWETNLISTPDEGTLTFNLDGTFSYLPPNEYCGQVSFEYELCNINCPDLCDIGMVTINVIPETDTDLDAPNVITPNGDKYNESLIIPKLYNNPTAFPDNKLVIFNQWGSVVFEIDNYQNDWNGVNQNGKELPQATYFYYFDDGQGEKVKGKVVILKE